MLRNKSAGAETTLVKMPRGQGTTSLHTNPSSDSDSGKRLGHPSPQVQDKDSLSALSSLKHAVRELHRGEKLNIRHRVFACPWFLLKKCGQGQCLCSPFQPPLCHGFCLLAHPRKGSCPGTPWALLNAMRAKCIMLRLRPAHGESEGGRRAGKGERERKEHAKSSLNIRVLSIIVQGERTEGNCSLLLLAGSPTLKHLQQH